MIITTLLLPLGHIPFKEKRSVKYDLYEDLQEIKSGCLPSVGWAYTTRFVVEVSLDHSQLIAGHDFTLECAPLRGYSITPKLYWYCIKKIKYNDGYKDKGNKFDEQLVGWAK
jgi:hypothetical protein